MSGDETLPEKLQQRFSPTFSKPTYTNGIGNRVKLLTISIPTLHCLLVLFASCWLRIQISRSDSHPVLIKSEHYRNSLFLIALRKLQKALFGKEKSEDIINSMLINYNLKNQPWTEVSIHRSTVGYSRRHHHSLAYAVLWDVLQGWIIGQYHHNH